MHHILLICSSGMSTSIIVRRMEQSAQELGVEAEIWADGLKSLPGSAERADVILVGPQVRFALEQIKKQVPDKPCAVVDMRTYGMMDGSTILGLALKLIDEGV